MAGLTHDRWWWGLCWGGLPLSVHRIWTWYLCLFVHSRYWQKGNTQCACVWKHVLLSHFVFYFCGYESLETEPVFCIFRSPQGLGSSHSFKQWPFFQFWAAVFSYPVEFVSPTLPAHAVCLHMQHWWCRQQEWGGDVSCLSHWTGHRRELHQVWEVPGTFVAGCKCHPWSFGSACWFISQVAIAERREIQQLRHSLLLLDISRRYFFITSGVFYLVLLAKVAHRFTSVLPIWLAEVDSYFSVEARKGMDHSFVFREFPLGVVSGWGLHGGGQSGKSPLLQQVQLQGLLGVGSGCATHAQGAGSASHSGLIFPQTPSVFAVATVPFGQTIFGMDTFQKRSIHAWWLSAAVVLIWVSTENRRPFLCLYKSQDQLGPVREQWLSGVGQKSGLAHTSVQSFNQNELNSNLLLGNEQIGSLGYRCYSVSWIYVFVQSMGARVKIRAVWAL